MTSTAALIQHNWGTTAVVPTADDHSVIDRWARVVAAHPDEPALAGNGVDRTFRETDARARSVAARLRLVLRPDDRSGAGVGAAPGGASVPIGVMAGQTTDAVVGLLALAMAHRTVVMLDHHLPDARLRHVVELAGVTEVIADAELADLARTIVGADGVVHLLADLVSAADAAADASPESAAPGGDAPGGTDPFVIVFTSGSTGMPKGVAMTHRQQIQNAENDAVVLGFGPGDRFGVALPLSFAAGMLIGLGALLGGAAMVLLDARDTGTDKLLDGLAEHRANGLLTTPHLLRSIVAAGRRTPLRLVMSVGEPITGTDVTAARGVLGPDTVIWNGFGASEMGCVAYFPIAPGDDVPAGVVPAGYPLPGKSARVIREDGSAAPLGETGELVIVSNGMTAGYWGAPEKTAERLGSTDDGVPTWRQGDLAKLEADGRLVLLGRSDDAVKVRGYLVEPSEVEAALRAMEDVHDVVVTALVAPPAVTRLVAYVVGRPGRRTPAPAALRRALRDRLPEYMVPASIVPMPELPRNERGKVDRALLPGAPAIEVDMVLGEYDQWEIVVGQIWAEVLGLRGVHLDEDFTALGGDSLTAEEMLAIIDERLGVDLRASTLLEHPTLRAFAWLVRSGAKALPSHPDIVKVSEARAPGRPPVFCLAGGGALGLTFLPLSRYLPEHDVYAIQQHALERRGVPDWSIEQSARRYIALMRIVQPRGPYILIGHSLGGIIALEVARLLTEAGEEIEHLALLDSYLPRTRSESAQLNFARMEPREHRNRAVRALQDGLDRAVKRVLPSGVPYGALFARRARAYGAGLLRYGGQKDFDAMFDQAEMVVRRHTPTPFHGRSTFVLAVDNPDTERWSSVLRGETRTVHIAAEHTSLLREPHVAELARELREALQVGPHQV